MELDSIIFFGLLALAEAIAHRCKDENRKNRLDVIGIAFFVIAVAFEGIAYQYGQRNDELSEGFIVSLSKTATKALCESDSALANAGTAKTTAERANLASSGAVLKAGAAEISANKADIKSSAAMSKAESVLGIATDAKASASEAIEKVADRRVSESQKALFKGAIAGGPSQFGFEMYFVDTPEARQYALDLRSLMSESGLLVQSFRPTGKVGVLPGVTILLVGWPAVGFPDRVKQNRALLRASADTFKRGLKAIRVRYEVGENDNAEATQHIAIIVGPKPLL